MNGVLSITGHEYPLDVHMRGAIRAWHGQLHVDVGQVSQGTIMPTADVPWLLSGCLK